MADRTHIAEIDYLMGQYFSKYIAPSLLHSYNSFREKQNKEVRDVERQLAYTPIGAGSAVPQTFVKAATAATLASQKPWNRKTIEDFVDDFENKISNNKRILKDWSSLVERFDIELYNKYGEKKYLQLCNELKKKTGYDDTLGSYYSQIKFANSVEYHLAKHDMPKSSIEYFLRHSVSEDSLLGKAFTGQLDARKSSPLQQKVSDKGYDMYNPSFLMNTATTAAGLVFDTPLFNTGAVIGRASMKTGAMGFEWFGKAAGNKFGFKAADFFEKYATTNIGSKSLKAGVKGFGKDVLIFRGTDIAIHGGEKLYNHFWGNPTEAQTFSAIAFGSKDALNNYHRSSNAYKKNGTEYLMRVNSELNNKVKVKPLTVFTRMQKEAKDIIHSAGNNASHFHTGIQSAMSLRGIPFNGAKQPPSWMLHMTVKQNSSLASFFFSKARSMQLAGQHTATINGHSFTLREVAQRASDYSKAAAMVQNEWKIKKNADMSAIGRKLIADFGKLNISVTNAAPKRWMLMKSSSELRSLSNAFERYTKQMYDGNKPSMKINGKTFTWQQTAQRAVDYAAAAVLREKMETAGNTRAAAPEKRISHKGHTNISHQKMGSKLQTEQVSIPDMGVTQVPMGEPIRSPRPGVQPTYTSSFGQPAGVLPPGIEGWRQNNINSMGRNGLESNMHNFSSILSVLPDMLIGMFTGKTPNMQLKDNLLPLSMIFGGMYMKKSPLLRMLMIGYGASMLFHNTGNALKADAAQKQADESRKVYKHYSDEQLDARIKDPVVKGHSLIADIDGRPMVVQISNTAIDAYEKGAVPLNVLANAVLKKYDEHQQQLQNSYARIAAEAQDERQQMVALR